MSSLSLPGQNDRLLDSLEDVLSNATNPKQQIEIYFRLADLTVYNNPQASLEHSKKALELSLNHDTDHSIAKSYYRIGSAFWSIGDLASALEQLQLSLSSMSEAYDPVLNSKIYMRIGSIYSASDDNVKGIYYYSKAIPFFSDLEDDFIKFAVFSNIGKALMDINYLDSASQYFTKAQNLTERIPKRFLPILLFNIADLQYQLGNSDRSLEIMNRCDSLATVYGDLRSQIRVAQLSAEIALKNNQVELAASLIEKATKEAQMTQVKELIAITQETQANVLEQRGEIDAAFTALKLSRTYFDSIQSTQAKNKLELYNFDESEEEKEELRKQQEISELKASNRQLIAIASVAIAFLMIAVAITNIRRQRMIKKQNKNLQDKNELIEQQKAQLNSLNNFKTKVMGIMAHDVKGPIQSIYGIMDIIDHQLMTPEELKEFLPHMNAQLTQVNLLLNNIFEWSRAGINEESVKPEQVNLSEVVQSGIEENELSAKQKSLVVENLVPEHHFAFVDAKMIKVVIRNLFYNAIKYSNEGGKITFTGDRDEKNTTFSISDQGVGMTRETIERLFSYDTESEVGTAQEIGTGFGLIVCKDFIDMNNGSIEVSSQKGSGTTFNIKLPKA